MFAQSTIIKTNYKIKNYSVYRKTNLSPKTIPTKNRFPLCWLKWNSRFLSTLRTNYIEILSIIIKFSLLIIKSPWLIVKSPWLVVKSPWLIIKSS